MRHGPVYLAVHFSRALLYMNFDKLLSHDLPTGVLVVIGVALLFVVLRTGKFVMKLVLLSIVAGLFAAAYWWYFLR
jgi:hypothetical protein